MKEPLLKVRGLRCRYPGARVPALDGVDLDLDPGGALALVGESGSGKSTLARCLLGLERPEAGSILLRPPGERLARDGALAAVLRHHGRDGALDLASLPRRAWRPVRRLLALVFQDPRGSLNPWMPVREAVAEPLLVHGLARGREARRRAEALLEQVGLPPGAGEQRPEALSGGQCQRVALARALAADPVLLVLDEAVAALDVSVQARILHLLLDLRSEFGLAWIFISHDLAVVRYVAEQVAVLRAGRVLEAGPTERVFARPAHPYTQALLAAVPRVPPRPGPSAPAAPS